MLCGNSNNATRSAVWPYAVSFPLVLARSNDDDDLLTDDFAPVNLYETIPAREHKRE